MRVKWLVLPILLAMVIGCAGGWGNKAVGTYELLGTTLKAAHDTVRPACDGGTLPADKCERFKGYYQKARTSYILAGDTLTLAVLTEDAVKRNAILVEYNQLTTEYLTWTQEAIKLMKEMGVVK